MFWFFIESSPSVQWESWEEIKCWLWAQWWPRWEKENFRTPIWLMWVCWHIWGHWRTGALKRWISNKTLNEWTNLIWEDMSMYLIFLFVLFFQMRAVISGVMQKNKLKVEQLAAVDLATFGHLICGLYPSEIKRLSPYNLRSVTYLKCIYPTSSNSHIQHFNKWVSKVTWENQQSCRHCKMIQ